MKRFAVLLIISVAFAVLLAACGNDEVAPSDPGASAVIPDTVFFNLTGDDEVVLFSGGATDNRVVDSVDISFDNGANWHAAEITPNPTIRDVLWSYYATNADMPTTSTVLIRVADQDDNETTSSPFVVNKASGSTTTDLLDFFAGSTGGDVIALSSGAGDAYGDSNVSLTIPISVNLTILGAGYGNEATSGGVTVDAAATATYLEATVSTPAIFSVAADLTIRNIRFVGSAIAIKVEGADASVTVEDCLFDGQDAWAIWAAGGVNTVDIQFLTSGVDAFSAGSTSRGGLYLEDVTYEVTDSDFFYMTDPEGPEDGPIMGAAVQAVGGSGIITESFFTDNGLAIWASGGSPLITSCEVSGATADTSYGINLTGESENVMIRRNTISGHSGYGVRIGDNVTPKLRRNVISSNGLSGILVDFSGPPLDVIKIDLGQTTDFGYNDLFLNYYPAIPGETQIYITSTTTASVNSIPAEYNYWGVPAVIIESVVYHGYDSAGRAMVDFSPAFDSQQN